MLVKNGRVVDPLNRIDEVRDVAIEDGVIREVAKDIRTERQRRFRRLRPDRDSRLHRHARAPARAGLEHAETIESGPTRRCRGIHVHLLHAEYRPVNDSPTVTHYILERARQKALVNVYPIGAITKGSQGDELAALGSMKKAGIVAISDDGRPVMNAG